MGKGLDSEPKYIANHIVGFIKYDGTIVLEDKSSVKPRPLNLKNINDKIIIYERQVRGWFLDCANRLSKEEEDFLIVLMISTSYIEGVQQYMKGRSSSNRESAKFFRDGIRRICGLTDDVNDNYLDYLYSQLRCGLFHDGMPRSDVIVSSDFNEIIDFSDNGIKINFKLFIDAIQKDFNSFPRKLFLLNLSGSTLR